jgi:hypothetical protein
MDGKTRDKVSRGQGIFTTWNIRVFMLLNYGEGKENAFMRLREEIERALKGRL